METTQPTAKADMIRYLVISLASAACGVAIGYYFRSPRAIPSSGTGGMRDTRAPFVISIVPERTVDGASHWEITSGADASRTFHVLLTNVSGHDQHVFETWNGWGYRNVWFEITS